MSKHILRQNLRRRPKLEPNFIKFSGKLPKQFFRIIGSNKKWLLITSLEKSKLRHRGDLCPRANLFQSLLKTQFLLV